MAHAFMAVRGGMNSESVQAFRYVERHALGAAGNNGMMGFRLSRTVVPVQQLAELDLTRSL